IEPAVRGVLQLLIVKNHGKRPATGLLGSFRVHKVEHARRIGTVPALLRWFSIVRILLELPALDHGTLVRNLDAIKIVLDGYRAFLRITDSRNVHGRRGNCGSCRCALGAFSIGGSSCGGTGSGGTCWNRPGRAGGLDLGSEERRGGEGA